VGVAAVRFGGDSVRLAIGFVGLAVIIAGLAVWQGHRWIQTADYRHMMALWAAGMLLHFTIFAGVVPNLARIHVAEAVAERLHNAANPATAIAAAGFHEPSLVFLLGRDLLLVDSREAALFLAEAPNGVALVEARQQTAFLDMARRLNLSLAAPQQVSGYNMSKGQDVVILIYRREIFDANSDTE
jgi:hypothetical protein